MEPGLQQDAVSTPADLAEAFARDGAVVVRGLFDSDQMARLTGIVEEMLDHPSPRSITASEPGQPAFVEDFCNWQRFPDLLDVARGSRLVDVAAEVMGSRSVRLYHDHVLNKQPGAATPTPWHQDQPYYNVDGRQNVSAWIPLDPVDRATTLEFVAGSHDGTWYLPTTFLDQQAKWFPAGSLQPVPPITPETHTVLGWAMQPGDAVLFHMLTLHGAAGNRMTTPRRALSLRLLGDDATHAPRRWVTSPPFPGLEDELPAGQPMDHPLFPLLG
ncbi:MAG TPA: phytanoyl-CoA dioxygenase family protein [Euzebya sp.]|nr:phytanoyl-CoA dioxygenase family protein [Euzebya sp.]